MLRVRYSISTPSMLRGLRYYSIPTTQKAVVFEHARGPLLYKDIPVPQPRPNELLINVKYSGVCHLDLSAWKGDWKNLPTKAETAGLLVGGHEGAGVVVGMGSNVSGWEVGDHAGVKFVLLSCWKCEYCYDGHEQLCNRPVYSGYTHDGSFQQYATVDAMGAPKIPQDVDLLRVGPILCGGITVYRALKTTTAQAGDWVVILGCSGGLGLLAVQYAKAMGMRVVGIDGGAEKGKAAIAGGVDEFIDFTECDDVISRVVAITNGGAKGAVNVSTLPQAIQQSIQLVKKRGVVVLVGLPPDTTVTASVLQTVLKSVRIEGSFVGNRADTDEAIDFFRRGLINQPITMAGLSQLPEIFDKMSRGEIVGRYVVDTSK